MSTLYDALQECARNTYNTKVMIRTDTGYSGKGLEYATRFLSGINTCLRKIAREKAGPIQVETVTTDEYGEYQLKNLSKPCVRVRGVTYFGTRAQYNLATNEVLGTPGLQDVEVEVTYEYMPTSLTFADLDNPLPIDERFIDFTVLCQYADYLFLTENATAYDTSNAQAWLGLFNDSYDNIRTPSSSPSRVRYNG